MKFSGVIERLKFKVFFSTAIIMFAWLNPAFAEEDRILHLFKATCLAEPFGNSNTEALARKIVPGLVFKSAQGLKVRSADLATRDAVITISYSSTGEHCEVSGLIADPTQLSFNQFEALLSGEANNKRKARTKESSAATILSFPYILKGKPVEYTASYGKAPLITPDGTLLFQTSYAFRLKSSF